MKQPTKKMKQFLQNKKVVKSVAGVAIAALLIGGGYYGYTLMQGTVTQQMPAPGVAALNIAERDIYPETSFVAKIESKDTVALRARVQGFLQERLFNEGDLVKKDQPLFRIERVNFEANVREAEANVAKAKAQVINTEAQFKRTETLYKTKDVSAANLDAAQAAYSSAQASLAQAEARLDLAKKDLEYTEIVAPMDGKIGESVYSVGELIGPESGVLANLVTIDPMNAVFSVSENQMLMLQKDFQKDIDVRFIKSDGSEYNQKGVIDFVDVTLDETMNTLKIKASFSNPDNELISGQYGRVQLKSTTPHKAIVVPMRSVQQDMIGSFVYVINDANQIERRDITRGTELENFEVVIESGLKPGDRIVTEGFQKIAPGATVTPVFDK